MKHRFFFILIGLCWTAAFGQDTVSVRPMTVPDSVFVVANVAIFGNTQTKAFVILREMSLREGALITRQQIEYDRNRIYSLGLFNQVEIGVIPALDSLAMLVVTVHERWYIFPYPIFGLKDRDWSKAFYGFGILHNNFLGRNEKIYTSFIFGYDPAIKITYRNPFLSEEGKHFLTASASFSKVRNRSLLAQEGTDNFDERHYAAGLTLGQRMGIAHTIWLSLAYESVSVSTYQPGRTLSPEGEDHYPTIGVGYAYDSRDLYEYPSRGSFAQFTITKFGFPGNLYDVVRYAADLRQYVPLGDDFVIQGRVFGDMAAAGPTPSYNRTYFGYGERIRGHFKEVIEGEHIFGVSAEFHYALLPPRYFRIGFLPEQFSVWKFGISAALFADAGSAWFRSDPFALNRFASGYGVGLHFLLPYSAVARVEYALNEVRHGEFIFDLGAAF